MIGLILLGATLTTALCDSTIDPSIITRPNQSADDSQEIVALIVKQYAAWGKGDINGYLEPYWRSPLLVYIAEAAVWKGFDEVKANVERDYPAQSQMGHNVLERLETNVIASDMAITLEWYNVTFPNTKVRGITSSTWRKLPEGWRIVQCQTAVLEN